MPYALLLNAGITAILIRIAWIDWQTGQIPNRWVMAVAALSMVAIAISGDIRLNLISAALMMALLLALRWFGTIRYGKPGFGMGDVKLLTVLSLGVGVDIFWVLYGACLASLLIYAVRRERVIRFGPAIALAYGVWFGYGALG